MYKIITAVLVVMLILSFGIADQIIIHKSFEEMEERASIIHSYINSDEREEAIAYTDATIEWWKKKRDYLELTCPHNEIKDAVILLAQLKGYLESDQLDDARTMSVYLEEDARNKLNILGYRAKNVL